MPAVMSHTFIIICRAMLEVLSYVQTYLSTWAYRLTRTDRSKKSAIVIVGVVQLREGEEEMQGWSRLIKRGRRGGARWVEIDKERGKGRSKVGGD